MCMLFLAAKDGFSYCREMSYMLQKCFILLFKVIIKGILCPDRCSTCFEFEYVIQLFVNEAGLLIV